MTRETMRPEGILETCLYVDDLDAAEQFYATVLGLEFVSLMHVSLRRGEFTLYSPRRYTNFN